MDAVSLLLVGCGKMGGALLERAGRSIDSTPALFNSICVVDPSPQPENLKSIKNLIWISAADKIDPTFKPTLTVLAIKPQQMENVLPAYGRFKETVFLSIAAGTTVATLERLLGISNYAIVRAMPNLPASIGQGITAVMANDLVTSIQIELCESFLKAVGDVVWLDDEKLLDAVTAFAGVPAYVFALCESLAKAGAALGLSPELAMQFARQNIVGSGALLDQSPESPEALRRAVTSPAGTTEAALKYILPQNALDEMMLKALTAGTNRAKELAK